MALVEGVEFSDAIAPAVEELVGRLKVLIGEDRCYPTHNQIRFAMQPPAVGIAHGVICRIGPRHDGALLKRARPPKTEPRQVLITTETLDVAFGAARGWFEEMVGKWNAPKSTRRNPAWTRDELILALDLYFRVPPWTIGGQHIEVLKLSDELNRLSAHVDVPDAKRYRNPSGCYMKLMNLRSLDPSQDGHGLKGAGNNDREVWAEFSEGRDELVRMAAAIRVTLNDPKVAASLDDAISIVGEVTDAVEGGILMRLHRVRERSAKLAAAKKEEARRKFGKLQCETCLFDFLKSYGEHGRDFIECHHRTPLAELPKHKTMMEDLALLCANCHRMIHRSRVALSVEALRRIIQAQQPPDARASAS